MKVKKSLWLIWIGVYYNQHKDYECDGYIKEGASSKSKRIESKNGGSAHQRTLGMN